MKKKNKRKGILITLISLIILCLICGTIGLLESKKETINKKPQKEEDYKASYKYYVDGEEVLEMPELETTTDPDSDFEGAEHTIAKYKFERYTCTNEVIGEFDEENWEFIPTLTNNTTCRLYFLKTSHEVTIKVSNGKLPNNTQEQKLLVELDKDKTINIIPNDGYKYEGVTCTNNAVAEYDSKTKDLKVSNVSKETTCNVSFTISDFTAELKVEYGNTTENRKSANYGGTLQFDVTPSENYEFSDITCTNKQVAEYKDNKVIIIGLTDNTVCTIEFKALKHKVTLKVKNGKIKNGKDTQEKMDGQSAVFEIIANDGYDVTHYKITSCENYDRNKVAFQNGYFTIPNITDNITCELELTKKADEATD